MEFQLSERKFSHRQIKKLSIASVLGIFSVAIIAAVCALMVINFNESHTTVLSQDQSQLNQKRSFENHNLPKDSALSLISLTNNLGLTSYKIFN